MPTLQLYLNSVPVDLPDNAAESIRINGAANDVGLLDSRIGERSYTITLPATRANDTAFRAARAHLTPGKFKSIANLPARLVCDGIDVLAAGAVCRLQSASAKGYEVVLYSAGVAPGEILDTRTLRQLTTLGSITVDDIAGLCNIIGFEPDGITPLSGALIAYGNFFAPPMVTVPPLNYIDSPLQIDDVVMGAWAAPVLRAIFAVAGYRIDGAPLLNETWLKTFMPYTSAEPYPWPWKTLSVAAVDAGFDAGGVDFELDPCELMSATAGQMYEGTVLTPNPAINEEVRVVARFLAQHAGEFEVTAQITGWYTNITSYTNYMWVCVTTPSGNEVVTLLDTNGGVLGAVSDSDIVTATVTVPERGSTIDLLTNNADDGGDLLIWTGARFEVAALDGAEAVDIALTLPDVSQKDFVKAFLTMFNVGFTIDAQTEVVRFYYREPLAIKDAENAVLLDGILSPEALKFRPVSSLKTLALGYQYDSADDWTPEGFGTASFVVGTSGQTEAREVLTPTFAATRNRDYVSLPPDPLYMGTYTLSLPCIADAEHLTQPRTEADWSYDYAPRFLVYTALTEDSNQVRIGTRAYHRQDTYFGLSEMPRFDGTGGLAANYAEAIEAHRTGDLATAELPLTPSLFRQLSPGRVVKLAGQLYRVNQLTNYRPGVAGSKATIELLRYVAPAGRD